MSARLHLQALTQSDPDACACLEWLEPPDDLQGLKLALQGGQTLLKLLLEYVELEDPDLAIDPSEIEQLIQGDHILMRTLEDNKEAPEMARAFPSMERKNPLHGIIRDHPIYALIASCASEAVSKPGLLLAAQLIASCKQLRTNARPGKDYSSSITLACNAARMELSGDAFSHLKPGYQEVEELQKHLNEVIEDGLLLNTARGHLRGMERIFRYLTRNTGGARRGGRPVRNDLIDLDGSRIRLQRITSQHSVNFQREARQSGLPPVETADDVEFLNLEVFSAELDQPDTSAPPSLAQQVINRRARIAQLERASQLLPSEWNRLTTHEIAMFLHLLKGQWQALAQHPEEADSSSRLGAIVALEVMFWTGRNIPSVLKLRLYKQTGDLPNTASQGAMAYVLETGEMHSAVLRPKAAPAYRKSDFTLAEDACGWMALPCKAVLHPYIKNLPAALTLINAPHVSRGVNAFETEGSQMAESLKAIMEPVISSTSRRVTQMRLENVMFNAILADTGDAALASLACGKPHRLADTALHYLNITSVTARKAYAGAAQRIAQDALDELRKEDRSPRPLIWSEAPPVACTYGSPIVPKSPTVSKLAEQLSQAMKAARKDVMTTDYTLALHNAYAAYVHFMLRFATGLRDVGEPLPGWERINLARRLVLLSDKDDVASYSSRIAPLVDPLPEQLLAWKHHVETFLPKLAAENVDVRKRQSHLAGFLFYLARKGDALVPTRMSKIETASHLEETFAWFRLPRNCNRHYLRSQLTAMGCPAEYMDAFMGHWSRGREPWGRYSCLSPLRYVEGIRPYLECIMASTGFTLVKGWC